MKLNLLTKTIVLFAPFTLLFFIGNGEAMSNSSGAPAARTGSPGDGANCRSCHAGATPATANLITSDIPVDGYVPGTTYNITASMTGSTNKFGFQISPQNTAGQLRGTLIATEPARTQLLASGKYITHKAAGNVGTSNTITWTFQWIAPVAGTGSLTFYGAFLASNNNSSSSGDAVFLSTLPVQENVPTISLAEKINAEGWNIFPVPCADMLTIKMPANMSGQLCVKVLSSEGAEKKRIQTDTSEHIQHLSIDTSDLPVGTYLVMITNSDGSHYYKKIVKL